MATSTKQSTTKATSKKTNKKTVKKASVRKPAAAARPATKKATGKSTTSGASPKRSAKKKAGARASAKSDKGRSEQIFSNLKRDFGKARDTLSTEFDKAVEAARKRLPKGGIVDEKKLRSVSREFRERMASVRGHLKDAGKRVSSASERLGVEDKARAVADASLTGLHAFASSLRGLAERLEESLEERRPYFTGEKVDSGRYACRDCSEVIITAVAELLPVCRGCGGKKFKHVG